MDRGGWGWEYQSLTTVVELQDERLNELGAEHWELVSAAVLSNGLIYYVFKRPVQGAAVDGLAAAREAATDRSSTTP